MGISVKLDNNDIPYKMRNVNPYQNNEFKEDYISENEHNGKRLPVNARSLDLI